MHRGHAAHSDDAGAGTGGSVTGFVDHEAAIAYLNDRPNFERSKSQREDAPETFKLDRMRALLSELGDPHLGVPVVHIAGSKGKGSVCRMLESCLRSCGYTTGLFTSPHLVSVRERVRINGELIDRALFDSGLARCRDAARAIEKAHGSATYFELVTALGFLTFAQSAVDVAVIETGLGGRLDCTNVVEPIATGITTIQLEHTDVLGGTLGAIALEKAGIMKPGAVCCVPAQDESVIGVFRERAQEAGCRLVVLGEDIEYSDRFQSTTDRAAHRRVCVGQGEQGFEHLSVPLLGEHQAVNCGLALSILIELRRRGFDLPNARVIAGLESTRRVGCLEPILDRPRIFIDGAHTAQSIRETLKAAAQQLAFDSLVVVMGCARDKNIDEMIEALRMGADKIVFTKASNNPRACDPEELCQRAIDLKLGMCESYDTVPEAVRAAAAAAGPQDLILALGSFVVAGEVKAFVDSRKRRAPA